MATYTFRFPGRDAGKTITVYDATNTQVASGAADANGVFAVSLASGDYYAMAPDGQYRRGDSDSPQSVEASALPATLVGRMDTATYTYNADGTIATETVGGLTTTYGWNPDGTLASMTRDGVTRAFTYTNGNLTAVS